MSSDIVVGTEKEGKIKLKLLASIDLSQDGDNVEEPMYSGLDFLPDGRLVVDNINMKCLVFNQNLETLNTFQLSVWPQAVVAVSKEDVAITSGADKSLFFLSISNQNEINFVRNCKLTKKYQSISMIDEHNMIVGVYDDNKPVGVVSLRGEEGELDIEFPQKTYLYGSSACTYIKNRKKVMLSDRFAHTISIYEKINNTRVEVKDEDIIKEPRGMAVGSSDSIFVCGSCTNSIVQISHTGQILSSNVLDMAYPNRVCVSKDNTQLPVSNNVSKLGKLQLHVIEKI